MVLVIQATSQRYWKKTFFTNDFCGLGRLLGYPWSSQKGRSELDVHVFAAAVVLLDSVACSTTGQVIVFTWQEFERQLQRFEPQVDSIQRAYQSLPVQSPQSGMKYHQITELWEKLWSNSHLYVERSVAEIH